MKSVFWYNVFRRLGKLEKSQKWLSETSGIGKTVINSGIARDSCPTIDNAYAIAKAFNATMEELVAGEKGAEYVRQWARKEGRVYSPPERIADIVEDLQSLSDDELIPIRGAIKAILDKKEVSGIMPEVKSDRKTG
jgi:hypothetical protein